MTITLWDLIWFIVSIKPVVFLAALIFSAGLVGAARDYYEIVRKKFFF